MRRFRQTVFTAAIVSVLAGCSGGGGGTASGDPPNPTAPAAWARSFGGGLHDVPEALAVTRDGGVLMAGQMSRPATMQPQRTLPWVARLDGGGDLLWQTGLFSLGEESLREVSSTPGLPFFPTADGTLVAATSVRDPTGVDGALVRLNSAGEVVWTAHIDSGSWGFGFDYASATGGPGEPPAETIEDVVPLAGAGYYVVFTTRGNIRSTTGTGSGVVHTARRSLGAAFVDEAGNVRWISPRWFDPVAGLENIESAFLGATLLPNGNLMVLTSTNGTESQLIELNRDGDEIRRQDLDGSSGRRRLMPLLDGRLAADGLLLLSWRPGGELLPSVVRLDADLSVQWSRQVPTLERGHTQLVVCEGNLPRRCEYWVAGSGRAVSGDTLAATLVRMTPDGIAPEFPRPVFCDFPAGEAVLDLQNIETRVGQPPRLRALLLMPDRGLRVHHFNFDCSPSATADIPLAFPARLPEAANARFTADGGVFIDGGAPTGAFLFDPQGREVRRTRLPEVAEGVAGVAELADGDSAVFLTNGRLVFIDSNGRIRRSYVWPDAELPSAFHAMVPDPQGRLWITRRSETGYDFNIVSTDGTALAVDTSVLAPLRGLPGDSLQLVNSPQRTVYVHTLDTVFAATHSENAVTFRGFRITTNSIRDLAPLADGRVAALLHERVTLFDASGNVIWERTIGLRAGYDEGLRSIAAAPDGGVIVALAIADNGGRWRSDPRSRNDKDLGLLKLDSSGRPQWLRIYGAAMTEDAFRVRTRDARIALMAESDSLDAVTPGSKEMWMLATGPDGHVTFDTTTRTELCNAALGTLTGDALRQVISVAPANDATNTRELPPHVAPVAAGGQLTPVDQAQTTLESTNTARQCSGPATDVQEPPIDLTVPPAATVALTVTLDGDDQSQVTGQGIACPGDCTESHALGTVVTLTATPRMGQQVQRWAGCSQTNGNQCTVTISAAQNVTVFFVPVSTALRTLTVVKSGAGLDAIRITSEPSGIDCGATCAADYQQYTNVILRAAGNVSWNGCDFVANDGACSVEMSDARTVTASPPAAVAELNVFVGPAGRVSSTPAGIAECRREGGTCAASFATGTVVTLTATPQDDDTVVDAWNGCDTTAGNDCTVTMNGPRTVGVAFRPF